MLRRTGRPTARHVTGRWRLIDEGNMLEVRMAVDDPDIFNQPWQAVKRYRRGKRVLTEDACAENNGIVFDYGTPEAKAPDFWRLGKERTMSGFTVTRLAAAGAFACLMPVAASAQDAGAGVPDFAANGTAWAGIGGGELLPVEGSPKPVTQDPRYKYTPNGTGEQPTFRISDTSNPNLKPWAIEVMKKDDEEVLKGKIGYTARSSCRPGGVPGFITMGGGALFFVQSPTEVTMIFDGNAETRHVHLNVPHASNPKPSWYGDSVGHYEGDTLVIDTIAMNDKSTVDAYRTPHTDRIHTMERWRLIDNGDKLEVLVTVDDPGTFNQPWQAVRRYQRTQRALVENICAENNSNLFDYGTPQAKTPDF